MGEPRTSPWRTLRSRPVYANPWIAVREDDVVRPDGQPGIYGVVSFRTSAVGVVPLHDDGTVTLVGQWRYTLGAWSWEVPEGGCPADEDPLEAARRELREETGLTAATWTPLGGLLHLSNSVSDEAGRLWLATSLTAGAPEPEGTERIETCRVPLAEALAMCEDGRITDALTVVALLRAATRV